MKINIPGPAPWYLRNYKFANYDWENGDSPKFLMDKLGRKIIGIEMYTYLRKIGESKVVVWSANSKRQKLELAEINLDESEPIVGEVLNRYAGCVFNNVKFNKYEIDTRLNAGVHQVPAFDLESECILADYLSQPEKLKDTKMKKAIYDLDFRKGILKIVPIKWFNEDKNIDFGYQWITRIKKESESKYYGDGIRFDPFYMNDKGERI